MSWNANKRGIECMCIHIISPFGVTIVSVHRAERSDVVRLAIVVPGNDFHEARTQLQDLVPAIVPEGIRRENEVLAVSDFGTEMGKEPR